METVSVNMTLVYEILCDFKTLSSQANVLLVIEFHSRMGECLM